VNCTSKIFYTDLKKEVSINIKELREKAIKRYENSESPKEIYHKSLGKVRILFLYSLSILYVVEKLTEN